MKTDSGTPSDTPRTDTAEFTIEVDGFWHECVEPDFARELEREAAQLRADNEALAGALRSIARGYNGSDGYIQTFSGTDCATIAEQALAAHAAKGAK